MGSSIDQQSNYGTARRRNHPQQHENRAQSNSSYVDVGRIGAESMGLGRDFFSGNAKYRVPTIKISGNSEWRRGSRALLLTVAFLVCTTGFLSVRSVQSLRLQQQVMKASSQGQEALRSTPNLGITAQSNLAMTHATPPNAMTMPSLQANAPLGQSGVVESLEDLAMDVLEDVILKEPQPKDSATMTTSQQQANTVKTHPVPLQESLLGEVIPMQATRENSMTEALPMQDTLKTEAVQLQSTVPQGEGMPKKATNVRHRPLPRGKKDTKKAGTRPGEPAPPHVPVDAAKSEHDKKDMPKEDETAATPAPAPISTSSTTTTSSITTNTNNNTDTTSTVRNTKEQWDTLDGPAPNQMMVISSVAVMALAVGAVSARKLRSKPFLSDCIENESLEDDLAYDTENTFGGVGQYGSFSAPWRGDLEKFDV